MLTMLVAADLRASDGDADPAIPRALEIGFSKERIAVDIEISLSARTTLRVFTLSAPRRVVLDLQNLDWTGISAPVTPLKPVTALRFGPFRDGWSRLVLDIDAPYDINRVSFVERPDGAASERTSLVLRLLPVSPEAFDQNAGPPPSLAAELSQRPVLQQPAETGLPLIIIDAGHGGVDPGALRDGLVEKDVALRAAVILAETLEATGRFRTGLTRSADMFLALDERVRIAQRNRADLFLSVHANTEPTGEAWGVSVFSLSEEASDAAAAALARLENRADLSAGLVDATTTSAITRILADLSRRETNARSRRLADAIVAVLDEENRTLPTKPHRAAGFRVLKAPDIPSLLIELGFLTNEEDRARLSSDLWLRQLSQELAEAILQWHDAEAQRASRAISQVQ